MIFGFTTFKIIYDTPTLHPRWLPLLFVEISLNAQKKKELNFFLLRFRSLIENQVSDNRLL
jgi:hypothetical protein